MSGAIGPGDFVEFIDDALREGDWDTEPTLTLGAIYRVHDIVPGWYYADGQPGLELVEVPELDPAGCRQSWAIDRFRPVYRPDESLRERLLEGIPATSDDLVPA